MKDLFCFRSIVPRAWALALCAICVAPKSAAGRQLPPPANSINLAYAPAPAVAASPAGAGVSAQSNNKIKMVTETLKDILLSVVNEEKQETAIYTKFVNWCKEEATELATDLKETRSQLGNSKVLSQEQVASIDNLNLFLQKSQKEIEELKDATAQAVGLRNGEKDKFVEEMQINTQGLRQLDLAIKHVGKVQKQGGFLQNGIMKKVQLNQPGESSYVLGVLKGLKDKLSKSRSEMRQNEEEQVKMHSDFMETKAQSFKALGDKSVEKKIQNTEVTAVEARTKRKIQKLTDEVAKLLEDGDKTARTCETTRQEWKLRQADRTKEKAALNEAIRYLFEMSLEQVSLLQHKDAHDRQTDDSVVFAPDFFQEVTASSNAEHEFFKAAEAELNGESDEVDSHLKKEAFDGVKKVVQKLIVSHQDAQKEETAKRDYCRKQFASKEDEKSSTTDDEAAIHAGVDKKASEVGMLTDEIAKLYKSIEASKKSLVDATAIRKEQHATYLAGSKDRSLAIKVLAQAKSVLQNFYDNARGTFLQQPGKAPPTTWSPISPRRNAEGFGALSMVQEIADDIAKEQKDATMQENVAAAAFVQLQEDTRNAIDEKHQDITERVTAKAKLGVQINGLKETGTQKSNDRAALETQLKALHKSCDEVLKFYDSRAKSRHFEVSQLKDVMDVLSGSSISVRTGLIESGEMDDVIDGREDDEDDSALSGAAKVLMGAK